MANAAPGDFSVTVSLFDADGGLLAQESHTVPGYAGGDFELPAAFASVPTESAEDTNGDGLFEYLTIEMTVSSLNNQSYYIQAVLTDGSANTVQTSTYSHIYPSGLRERSWYDSQGSTCAFWVDDGPYQVAIHLLDGYSNVIATYDHVTGNYDRDLFQVAATLQAPQEETAIDANGNGIMDELVIRTDIDVTTSDVYIVNVALKDPQGVEITGDYLVQYLQSGTSTQEIHLPGSAIANHGVDGPYAVEILLRDDRTGNTLDMVAFNTISYLATDFEQLVHFQPPYTTETIDSDSDGLYELLIVDVGVYSDLSGDSVFWGILKDGSGDWVATSDTASPYLFIGDNTASLKFNGKEIAASGLEGPYSLYMIISSGGIYDEETITIDGLGSSDFEAPASIITIVDSVLDEDGNGLYDQLIVDISIDVSYPTDYSVYADLKDSSGQSIESQAIYLTELTIGINAIQLSFSSNSIVSNGADGPFEVSISLYLQGSYDVDGMSHTTEPYLASEFQQDAWFSEPISDYGLDTDGNGLSDQLVLDLTIETLVPGNYEILGYLDHQSSVSVYLDEGVNSVQLIFPIINWMPEGTRVIDLFLRDETGMMIDHESYNTNSYGAIEFESAHVTSFAEMAVDENINGLYEYIQVELGAEVTVQSIYALEVYLRDVNGWYIASDWMYAFMLPGYNQVSLSFLGEEIYQSGKNGPYTVEVRFREASIGTTEETGASSHFHTWPRSSSMP